MEKKREKAISMRILVDTSVLIDVLRGKKETIEKLKQLFRDNQLYISGLTEMELLAGKENEEERKMKRTKELISTFEKINPDNLIFQIAAEFRRKYNVSSPDCIIAATAYVINAKIWTEDYKDFRKIKEIEVI